MVDKKNIHIDRLIHHPTRASFAGDDTIKLKSQMGVHSLRSADDTAIPVTAPHTKAKSNFRMVKLRLNFHNTKAKPHETKTAVWKQSFKHLTNHNLNADTTSQYKAKIVRFR